MSRPIGQATPTVEELEQRINELEEQNSHLTAYAHQVAQRSDRLVHTLDAAKALPEKWRDEHYCPSGGGVDARCSDLANELADELEAALSGKLQPKQGEDA